jgi:hypothetical protein
MKRRFVGICALLCLSAVWGSFHTYGFHTQLAQTNMFVGGEVAREITIRTEQGQILSVLTIPAGVMLSVHGQTRPSQRLTDPILFEGTVNIRTKPEADMDRTPDAVGDFEQMLNSPFNVDVQDAVVEVKRLN